MGNGEGARKGRKKRSQNTTMVGGAARDFKIVVVPLLLLLGFSLVVGFFGVHGEVRKNETPIFILGIGRPSSD